MTSKIKLENDEEVLRHRTTGRTTKLILGRTLVTSVIVFTLLMVSVLYHGLLLKHLDGLQQIAQLDRKQQHLQHSTNYLLEIPDNELITIEGKGSVLQSATEDESLLSLNIKHGKMKFSRRRLSRDIVELDPILMQQNFDLQELKSKVRNKRERFALSKLEKEYMRCKKSAHHNNECVVEFVRLYKVAKELSEKMEKMVEMFKDSEQLLQQQTSISNSDEKQPSLIIDDFSSIGGKSSEANFTTDVTTMKEIKQSKPIIEKLTTNQFLESTITSTEKTTNTEPSTSEALTTLTSTTKQFKIKPIRISWIIDGHDDIEETTQTSTSQFTISKIPELTTEKVEIVTKKSVSAELTTEKVELVTKKLESPESTLIDDDFNSTKVELSTTPSITIKSSSTKPLFETTNQYKEMDDNVEVKSDDQRFKLTTRSFLIEKTEKNLFSTTSTISLTTESAEAIEINQERLRKLKFDWILDGEEETTPNDEQVQDKSSINSETNATIINKSTKSQVHPTKPKIIKYDWIVDSDALSAEISRSDNQNITHTKPTTTTKVHHHFNKADLLRTSNETHPLDYPTSLENFLGRFEKSDFLHPLANKSEVQEKIQYDPIIWAKQFQEAALASKPQTELLDTFGDADFTSPSKLGPKLNPANMKFLNDEDSEILSLCERMAKRLRKNETIVNSSNTDLANFTKSPNAQFTVRGPADFPFTGESIKSSAQFMLNPNYGLNFGMPTVPICFYLTPTNFRMPHQMTNMWGQPLMGMPNFYGGMGSGVMGPDVGPTSTGVFVMPQNVGTMANAANMFNQMNGVGTGGNNQNAFTKNITPQHPKQQQFYCTYMQNDSNQGSSGVAPNTGFSNMNSKMRQANQTSGIDIIYASYAGLPNMLGREDQFKCELPDSIACYGGNQCVREDSWCDGIVDCSDSSDESACSCQDRLTEERLCDGYPDCPMGEDEIGCFGCDKFMYSCHDNVEDYKRFNGSTVSMCYSSMEKCDGVMNCLNGKDELGCNVLVNDLTSHMSHSVSTSEGFLFRNHRGQWYPVCNNPEKWAKDACSDEGGYTNAPNITYRELTIPGPFIEPSHFGDAHFPHSCQKRNAQDKLIDRATYVKCAACKCGHIKKFTMQRKTKRSKNLQKRIIANIENESEETSSEERIVGGKYSKPLEWPFVVAIYRNGKFHCGGSIYNERWIISAAHCAINYQKYYYEVQAGLLRRSSYSAATQIQPVTHVVVHQGYQRRSMRNDLSLMKLAEPLGYNRWIKPICMPDIGRTTSGDDWIWGPDPDTVCTAVGWGAIREKGPGSDSLREVVIPIIKRCTETMDQQSESICAGEAEGGFDACQGDSGGPLFCRSVSNSDEWYLAGVVSHGNGCARPGEFGVYTRVALYLDWLEMATNTTFLPELQPKQNCPGFTCAWGGKRCIPESKRCNRMVDCLGGEDEVGCVYNFIPDVGSVKNATTTESDYFPENELTTEQSLLQQSQNLQTTEESTIQDDLSTTNAFNKEMTNFVFELQENIEIIESTSKAPENATQSIFNITLSDLTTKNLESTSELKLTTMEVTTPTSIIPSSTEDLQKLITISEEVLAISELTKAISSTTVVYVDTTTKSLDLTTEEEQQAEVTTTETVKKVSSTTPKTKINPIPQLPEKFICRKMPQIIEMKHRCDRHIDCEDGTDEESCSCVDYLKGSLNILVCDGKADCEDNADEEDCGKCQSNEFQCPLSKQCIPSALRCNNVSDCQFKEDEQDCFALTNGKELKMDVNKKPVLSNAGIFTRNTNGIWQVVCSHETNFHVHSVKTIADICGLLGFRGFKFYNTTSAIQRDHLVVPIDPDIVKKERLKAHLTIATSDNLHFSSNEQLFPIELKKSRIERVHHGKAMHGTCLGLYVECNAAFNKTQPLKTLSAGGKLTPDDEKTHKMKPTLFTHSRPNVFIKPQLKTKTQQLIQKKDELLQKLEPIIETKNNVSILVNNQLHEAVAELHWPWLVDIYANGKLWCAGVLLDKYWVLVHESCYFGIRLNTDYVVALLGGGKTKQMPHKSPNEQIRRINCFKSVVNSDVLLYHLERPAHFTHHILPTFLPETTADNKNMTNNCIAILHDEETGRFKTVPIKKEKENETLNANDMSFYRLMENKPLLNLSDYIDVSCEDIARISDEVDLKLATQNLKGGSISSALTKFTVCSQFGYRPKRDVVLEPVDQGILACRDNVGGWFPAALFSYNNTDCRSFNESFAIRTLENVYEVLQDMIEQPKCHIAHVKPTCDTFRCPLGKCLTSDEICNGQNDCHDGSDEDATFCLKYKKECEPSEMQCRSSKKCIPKTKFCDHVPDCDDLTDEPTICSCFTYLRATDPAKICDGIRNCWDKSDESPALCNCTSELFPCGISSNECIPHDFVCDKEPDCPNGEDERYCFGIEQPLLHPIQKNDPLHSDPSRPPKYGQVIEQSYGVWHTKCFPRSSPPDISEIRQICKKLGYKPYRQPSYRLIDDEANEVVDSNEPEPDLRGRSFGNSSTAGKYRYSTKAVVVSKFSPLHLNNELTLFIKPSRPIAELVRWNATDSSHCYRLEIRCG